MGDVQVARKRAFGEGKFGLGNSETLAQRGFLANSLGGFLTNTSENSEGD